MKFILIFRKINCKLNKFELNKKTFDKMKKYHYQKILISEYFLILLKFNSLEEKNFWKTEVCFKHRDFWFKFMFESKPKINVYLILGENCLSFKHTFESNEANMDV